jgi:hypothetical protein
MTLDVTGLSLRDLTSCGGCAAKADAIPAEVTSVCRL